MRLIAPAIAAARVQAALGFAGIEISKWGTRRGVTQANINRIAARNGTRGATIDELWAIADECGIPRLFMTEGFGPLEEDWTERVAVLEGVAKVLLPLLLERHAAAGEQLPPDAVQALELVLGMKGQ